MKVATLRVHTWQAVATINTYALPLFSSQATRGATMTLSSCPLRPYDKSYGLPVQLTRFALIKVTFVQTLLKTRCRSRPCQLNTQHYTQGRQKNRGPWARAACGIEAAKEHLDGFV